MAIANRPVALPRRRGDLARGITPYTSLVIDQTNRVTRDMILENPWIEPAAVPLGSVADETHWLTMESDPAVSGAIAARIAQLLGGGVKLEAGEGEGAQELLEFWEDMLGELPLVTMSALGLMAFFRGWRPFEIIGANRPWNGRTAFAPVVVRNALSWHFRWTVGRDLVYRPGGAFGLTGRIYRRSGPGGMPTGLGGLMKWFCPAMGDLSDPYGFPLHRNWMAMDVAHRELSAIGMTHIRMSQGVLKVDEGEGLGDAFNEQDEAKIQAVAARVKSFIDEMQSGGAIVKPAGWDLDWLALPQAVGGWVGLFEFFRNAALSYYAQSNLSTSASGASGNRALALVQDAVGRRVAKLDACQYQEAFRAWLRAWSAANASVVAPGAFPGIGVRPQLLDVPLRAVPHLVFNSLNRITSEDLAVLTAVREIGVEMPEGLTEDEERAARIMVDVNSMLRTHNFRMVGENEVGAILDFSTQTVPPGMLSETSEPGDSEEIPAPDLPDEDEEI